MQNRRGNFLAENTIVSNVMSLVKAKRLVSFTARAEGEEGGQVVTPQDFTRLIEDARKQEKDKLYPKIQKLEADLKNANLSNNELIMRNAQLLKDIEVANTSIKDLNSKVQDASSEDLVKAQNDLKKAQDDLKAFEGQKTEEELRNEIRAELEKEYEVKSYLVEQLSGLKNGEVLDYFKEGVTGKTKEEIDSALEKAKQETLKVYESTGFNPLENIEEDEEDEIEEEEEPELPKKKTKKMTNPTKAKKTGKQYTAEDVANMTPEEYADFRKSQLKLK